MLWFRASTNPLQNVGSLCAIPLKLHWITAPVSPILRITEKQMPLAAATNRHRAWCRIRSVRERCHINPTRRRAMTDTRFPVRVVSTLAVLGILFAPVHAVAQVAVGTLVGSVRDDTGGGVPGATITATETRTNITRTAVSNESGNYSFNNLAPGVYRVDGELVGFKKFSPRGCRSQRQYHGPRGNRPRRRPAGRVGHGDRRGADAADRSHRHGPHHREHANHADAAGVQPQLPGAAHHGARRVASVPSAFGVLQLAGKPVEQRQRPVSAGQQRAARRRGQQRQRRQPCVLHSFGRSD